MPLIALIVRLSSRRIRESARGAQTAMGSIAHTLEETIEAHKVVKIFGGDHHATRGGMHGAQRPGGPQHRG